MERLINLRRDDKFKYNGHTYTVYQHEGTMCEVFGNGRWWAWPVSARVERIRK